MQSSQIPIPERILIPTKRQQQQQQPQQQLQSQGTTPLISPPTLTNRQLKHQSNRLKERPSASLTSQPSISQSLLPLAPPSLFAYSRNNNNNNASSLATPILARNTRLTNSASAHNLSNISPLNESQSFRFRKHDKNISSSSSSSSFLIPHHAASENHLPSSDSPPPKQQKADSTSNSPIKINTLLARNLKRKTTSLHTSATQKPTNPEDKSLASVIPIVDLASPRWSSQQQQQQLHINHLPQQPPPPQHIKHSSILFQQTFMTPRESLAAEFQIRRQQIARAVSTSNLSSTNYISQSSEDTSANNASPKLIHFKRSSIHTGIDQSAPTPKVIHRSRVSTIDSKFSALPNPNPIRYTTTMTTSQTPISPQKLARKSQAAVVFDADKKLAAQMRKHMQLLPIPLQDIVEKPFKTIALALRYGLQHCFSQDIGPNIQMSEYDIFAVFRRLVERYPFAMKKREEQTTASYGLQAPPLEEMIETVSKRIHALSETLNEINLIKDSTSSNDRRAQKVLLKLFEGFKYLVFVFFDKEHSQKPSQSNAAAGTTVLSSRNLNGSQINANNQNIGNNYSTNGGDSDGNSAAESLPELISIPSSCFPRFFHENFKKFFMESDFNVLLEFLVLPDCQIIHERATAYLHKYFKQKLQGINHQVNHTMQSFFDQEQSILFTKKKPQTLLQVFQLQPPSFTQTNKPLTVNVKNPQQKLASIVDTFASDLSSTVKKFAIKSPYNEDFDKFLKANLVRMYQTQSTQPSTASNALLASHL